jgi:hypothetical protein
MIGIPAVAAVLVLDTGSEMTSVEVELLGRTVVVPVSEIEEESAIVVEVAGMVDIPVSEIDEVSGTGVGVGVKVDVNRSLSPSLAVSG